MRNPPHYRRKTALLRRGWWLGFGLLTLQSLGCGATRYAVTPQDYASAHQPGGALVIPGRALPSGEPVWLRSEQLEWQQPERQSDGRLAVRPRRPAKILIAGSIVGSVGLVLAGAGLAAPPVLTPLECPSGRPRSPVEICGLGSLIVAAALELLALPHLIASTALLLTSAAQWSPETR
jgi:hypothetical protein